MQVFSFTYSQRVGSWTTATATVTIGIDTPTALPDNYELVMDFEFYGFIVSTTAANGVLANDSDPGGLPLTAELVSDASEGWLDLRPDGSFDYYSDYYENPPSDTFTYRAVNSAGTPTKTVTVTIDAGEAGNGVQTNPDAYVVGRNQTLTLPAPGYKASAEMDIAPSRFWRQ